MSPLSAPSGLAAPTRTRSLRRCRRGLRGDARAGEILDFTGVLLREGVGVALQQKSVEPSVWRSDEPGPVREKLDALVVILRIDRARRFTLTLETSKSFQRRLKDSNNGAPSVRRSARFPRPGSHP